MPTITYHRHWCTACKDWKLFRKEDSVWVCKTCGKPHEEVVLNTIPEDKLEEQRERYKTYRREHFGINAYLNFLNPMHWQMQEIKHMMSEPGSDIEIIEADAGQKYIDEEIEKERRKRAQEREEKRQEAIAELLKYKHTGRNDTCPCGSGKKYKKCCYERIQKLEAKYRYI